MADFDAAVKMHVESRLTNGVGFSMPILNLALKNSTDDADGKAFEWFIQKDTMADQAQAAGMFTPIEARRKNILLPATLPWKYARVTDIMTLLESAFSQGQSWIGTDFVKLKGEALVKGLKIRVSRMILGLDGMSTDGGIEINSLRQALTQDQTWAGLTRSGTTTNVWAQSASLDRTYTDQDTETRMSVDLIEQIAVATHRKVEDESTSHKLYHFMGEELWLGGKRELRSYVGYKGEGSMTNLGFGFKSYEIDGNEMVLCPELYDSNYTGTDTVYPSRWLFSIDPTTLIFKFHPEHKFKAVGNTGKVYEEQRHLGGAAIMLALADTFCNFAITNPNRNCFKTNVRA
jgi:hypothetical protein